MEALEARSLAAEFMRGRRGSIATQTVLVIPAMLGFTAVAVDAAYLYVERTHLQSVVDGAALAAGSAFESDDLGEVFDRAEFVIDENSMITGQAYNFGTIETQVLGGEWIDFDDPAYETTTETTEGWKPLDGTGLMTSGDADSDGVADDWESVLMLPRPALKVVAPPQSAGLFFGALFLPGGTTGVVAEAVVAHRPTGVGIPMNCGILTDTTMKISGSVEVDGYKSSDCGGDGTYDPATDKDLGTGVCSNGSVTGGGSSKMYGSIAWGPDADWLYDGWSAVPEQQLAQEVDLPPNDECTSDEADDSKDFWTGTVVHPLSGLTVGPPYALCVDLDGNGAPDLTINSDTIDAVKVDYDAKNGEYDVKLQSGSLVIDQSCLAPQDLCVGDYDTTSTGGLLVNPDSYVNGEPVRLMVGGDMTAAGQGVVNLDDSTLGSSGTYTSSGEEAAALRVFVQGDFTFKGGSEFSAVLIQGNETCAVDKADPCTFEMHGNTDIWGDFFAYGDIVMLGNNTAHLDRCYEISSGDDSACPDWWPVEEPCPDTLTLALKTVLVD